MLDFFGKLFKNCFKLGLVCIFLCSILGSTTTLMAQQPAPATTPTTTLTKPSTGQTAADVLTKGPTVEGAAEELGQVGRVLMAIVGAIIVIILWFCVFLVSTAIMIISLLFITFFGLDVSSLEWQAVSVGPAGILTSIANILIIGSFIAVGLGYLLDIKTLKIKLNDFFIGIAIYSILINLSLPLVFAVIGIFKGIGDTILFIFTGASTDPYGNLIAVFMDSFTYGGDGSNGGGLGHVWRNGLGSGALVLIDLGKEAVNTSSGGDITKVVSIVASYSIYLIILCIVFFAMFKLTDVAVKRFVMLLFCIIVSPITLACGVSPFPALKKVSQQWLNIFVPLLIFYPGIILGFAIAGFMVKNFNKAVNISLNTATTPKTGFIDNMMTALGQPISVNAQAQTAGSWTQTIAYIIIPVFAAIALLRLTDFFALKDGPMSKIWNWGGGALKGLAKAGIGKVGSALDKSKVGQALTQTRFGGAGKMTKNIKNLEQQVTLEKDPTKKRELEARIKTLQVERDAKIKAGSSIFGNIATTAAVGAFGSNQERAALAKTLALKITPKGLQKIGKNWAINSAANQFDRDLALAKIGAYGAISEQNRGFLGNLSADQIRIMEADGIMDRQREGIKGEAGRNYTGRSGGSVKGPAGAALVNALAKLDPDNLEGMEVSAIKTLDAYINGDDDVVNAVRQNPKILDIFRKVAPELMAEDNEAKSKIERNFPGLLGEEAEQIRLSYSMSDKDFSTLDVKSMSVNGLRTLMENTSYAAWAEKNSIQNLGEIQRKLTGSVSSGSAKANTNQVNQDADVQNISTPQNRREIAEIRNQGAAKIQKLRQGAAKKSAEVKSGRDSDAEKTRKLSDINAKLASSIVTENNSTETAVQDYIVERKAKIGDIGLFQEPASAALGSALVASAVGDINEQIGIQGAIAMANFLENYQAEFSDVLAKLTEIGIDTNVKAIEFAKNNGLGVVSNLAELRSKPTEELTKAINMELLRRMGVDKTKEIVDEFKNKTENGKLKTGLLSLESLQKISTAQLASIGLDQVGLGGNSFENIASQLKLNDEQKKKVGLDNLNPKNPANQISILQNLVALKDGSGNSVVTETMAGEYVTNLINGPLGSSFSPEARNNLRILATQKPEEAFRTVLGSQSALAPVMKTGNSANSISANAVANAQFEDATGGLSKFYAISRSILNRPASGDAVGVEMARTGTGGINTVLNLDAMINSVGGSSPDARLGISSPDGKNGIANGLEAPALLAFQNSFAGIGTDLLKLEQEEKVLKDELNALEIQALSGITPEIDAAKLANKRGIDQLQIDRNNVGNNLAGLYQETMEANGSISNIPDGFAQESANRTMQALTPGSSTHGTNRGTAIGDGSDTTIVAKAQARRDAMAEKYNELPGKAQKAGIVPQAAMSTIETRKPSIQSEQAKYSDYSNQTTKADPAVTLLVTASNNYSKAQAKTNEATAELTADPANVELAKKLSESEAQLTVQRLELEKAIDKQINNQVLKIAKEAGIFDADIALTDLRYSLNSLESKQAEGGMLSPDDQARKTGIEKQIAMRIMSDVTERLDADTEYKELKAKADITRNLNDIKAARDHFKKNHEVAYRESEAQVRIANAAGISSNKSWQVISRAPSAQEEQTQAIREQTEAIKKLAQQKPQATSRPSPRGKY